MTTLLFAIAALIVVMGGVQAEEGGPNQLQIKDQDLVNKVADLFQTCQSIISIGPKGRVRFTFGEFSQMYILSSVDVISPSKFKYTTTRDEPATMEMSDNGFIVSFRLRMQDFNRFNYTFNVESQSTKKAHKGSISVEIGDSFAFYQMRITKDKEGCKVNLETYVLETIGERTATVTDVPFFKEHKTLKDQVTYWAGTNLVRNLINLTFKKVVFFNSEFCVLTDADFRSRVCKLISTLPETPKSHLQFEFLKV